MSESLNGTAAGLVAPPVIECSEQDQTLRFQLLLGQARQM